MFAIRLVTSYSSEVRVWVKVVRWSGCTWPVSRMAIAIGLTRLSNNRHTRFVGCLPANVHISPIRQTTERTVPVERDKALEMALGQIEKQFGKGAIMRMGENTHMLVEAISTGALSLDLALGIGGLPRGHVVELFGPESSGKSPSPCTSWLKPNAMAAFVPTSTPAHDGAELRQSNRRQR